MLCVKRYTGKRHYRNLAGSGDQHESRMHILKDINYIVSITERADRYQSRE